MMICKVHDFSYKLVVVFFCIDLILTFFKYVQVGQFLYGQVGLEKGVNAVITNGRVCSFSNICTCLFLLGNVDYAN